MKSGIVNIMLTQGCILSMVFLQLGMGFLVEKKSAMQKWEDFRKVCGKNCDHGYYTDIEGNPICNCRLPCKSVLCFNGTECVVKDGVASCETKRPQKDILRKSKERKLDNEVLDMSNMLLQDSGTTSTTEQDVCQEPLREEAKKCDYKTKRFYFNVKKGKCVRFKGCETAGNNFAKRRDCKKTCMRRMKKIRGRKGRFIKRIKPVQPVTPSKETSNETNICNLPLEDATNCDSRVVRRWHFDMNSGLCVKVKACKNASGNYFRKRRECKRQCMRIRNRGRMNRKGKSKRKYRGRSRDYLRARING